jgi:hypothetical protein
LGPGKNEGRRLLRAVANDQLIAIDADRRAGVPLTATTPFLMTV